MPKIVLFTSCHDSVGINAVHVLISILNISYFFVILTLFAVNGVSF